MAENTVKKTTHEPLFHIAKRSDMVWWKAWLIRIVAILIAVMLVSVVLILLTGQSLGEVSNTMFRGAFGNLGEGKTRTLLVNLQRTAVLLCLSLAVTPAFKMKFWNCGAEGQALMGGLASMMCMIHLGDTMPYPLLIVTIIVTSILAGAIWGILPALFKAFYNTNETLFTLMMNYVATQIVAYYVYINGGGSGIIPPVSTGNFPTLFGSKYLLNILIVVLIMIVMYIYLKYSKQGYEIAVVGESQNTARYIGINVKKVIIRTMVISGAICGIAGMLLVSGIDHSVNPDTIGGQGFTAIMVSWLALFNPFIMVIMSALTIFLKFGTAKVADSFFLSSSFADIATGIVILFLVGCEFFIRYTIKFRRTRKEDTV